MLEIIQTVFNTMAKLDDMVCILPHHKPLKSPTLPWIKTSTTLLETIADSKFKSL